MSSIGPPVSRSSGSKARVRAREKGKKNVPKLQQTGIDLSKVTSAASTSLNTQIPTEDNEFEWPWKTLVDTSASSRPAVFTSDGNYFFSIVGSSVRIYSVASGRVVSALSSSSIGSSASRVITGEGHSDVITSILLNPDDPFQLLTASLDGDIKIWNYLDAVLVETIHIGHPILHMCAHGKLRGQVFIAVPTRLKKGMGRPSLDNGNAMIYRVSLKRKQTSSGRWRSSEIVRIGKTKAVASMGISPSGSWLVVVAGRKAYVSQASLLDSGFTKFVSPENLTCLAFHPTEDYFATGDELGQIRLWYCLHSQATYDGDTRERNAQTTTMHWHAHSVSSVAFSKNGAYLLSGGEECVLVVWQIQSGRKEYVPRLGSPISTISVRTSGEIEEYLLGLVDGSYLFVDSASLSVGHAISCIRLDPKGTERPAHTPVPLAAHRKTSTLILPASHPSSLQIFSPSSLALSELEISSSNRVSRRDERDVHFARVDFAVVSGSGDWMATVDARDNEEEFTAEINLKFWRWDSSSWVLSTRIECPHGPKRITAADFMPRHDGKDSELLMTVGLDGSVKMWCLGSVSVKNRIVDEFWINRSVLSFRSEMPTDARWSPDGTLVGVSFGRQIVLYDPYSNSPLDCLTTMDIRLIESLRFVGKTGRFILASGRNNAVLWDLITRRVCWHYYTPSTIAQVLAHPHEDLVALIAQPYIEGSAVRTCRVLHFNPTSAKPFNVNSLPFRFRAVDWNSLNNTSHSLVGITYSWDIVVCGDDSQTISDAKEVPQEIGMAMGVTPKKTLFQDIFGRSALLDISEDRSLARRISLPPEYASTDRDKRDVPSFLDVPAYLAPPVDTVFSSLIGSFLNKSLAMLGVAMGQDPDETEDMVVDSEPAQVLRRQRTVEDGEFNSLVDLFRKHTIDRTPHASIPNGSANGFIEARSNGVRPCISQSRPSTLTTPQVSKKGRMSLDISVSAQSSTLTTVTLGEKRKKSTS